MLVSILFGLCFCVASTSAACESKSITLDQKLALNADANDNDGDGVVTNSDVYYDLSVNYDTNNDGLVTEAEWITRWACAFGDTDYMARYAYVLITGGVANISIAFFNTTTVNFPRETFITFNRARYTQFSDFNCVNTDLTLDEKIAFIMRDNNHNNDAVVDTSDLVFDVGNNYDTNNDSQITSAEWNTRWVCAYGDSADFARFVWNQLTHGADFITTANFNGPPFDTGLPVASFEAMNRERYAKFNAQQASTVGK